jgi:hypothetical protein
MSLKAIFCAVLTSVGLACVPGVAAAATVYVDGASRGGPCDDARPWEQAQNAGTPWCSFARAYKAAPASSVAVVRGHSYPEVVLSGTTAAAPITFEEAPGEDVQVAGATLSGVAGLRFKGLTFTQKATVGDASRDVQFLGNAFVGQGGVGVTIVDASQDVLVETNSFDLPRGTGVNVSSRPNADGTTTPVRNVTVRWNKFNAIGRDALQLKAFDGLLVEGNEITGVVRRDSIVHPDTIQTFAPGGNNLTIRSNYFHDNDAGMLIKDAVVTGLVIENNLVVRTLNDSYALQVFDAPNARIVNNTFWFNSSVILRGKPTIAGAVILNNVFWRFSSVQPNLIAVEDHNLIQTGQRLGSNSFTGDPKFLDPANNDFSPGPGSPLIDRGSPLGTATDLRGARREVPDIGALEKQAPVTPAEKQAAADSRGQATTTASRRDPSCLASRIPFKRPGLGQIALRRTRTAIVDAVGLPFRRARRGLRYCVDGGGRVLVATNSRGRAVFVFSTARGHTVGTVGPGMTGRQARRIFRGRRLSRTLLTRRSGRSIFLAQMSRGRVAWVGVANRSAVRSARDVERLVRAARQR